MKDIRSFYLKSRTVNGRNCGKNKFKYYTILFYGIMTEKLIVTTHVGHNRRKAKRTFSLESYSVAFRVTTLMGTFNTIRSNRLFINTLKTLERLIFLNFS